MKLYEKLKKCRKERGFTLSQISKMINVTQSAVSRYENNLDFPRTMPFIKLAKLYSGSVDKFIRDVEFEEGE